MCVGCISSVDAGVHAAVGLAAAAESTVGRIRALLDPAFAEERHVRTWERNAAFCAVLGLEATDVLGPKPSPEPLPESSREAAWTRSRGMPLSTVS